MKVAAILLAVAVASVSAEKPAAEHPVTFTESTPAVRSNFKQAGSEAVDAGAHAAQAVVDIGREANANIVVPSATVVSETAKSAGHKTVSTFDGAVANTLGAGSAVQKALADGLRKMSEMAYNGAAKASRGHDQWRGAADKQNELGDDRLNDAKAPIERGVENVKATVESAKDKVVELKDRAADKAHAAKEDAKESAEDAKDSTKNVAAKSGNFFSRQAHRFGKSTGAAVEAAGRNIEEAGANLKDDQGAKLRADEARREELVVEPHNSAMSIAAPSAAFAIAAAAAVYLI